MEGTMKIRTIIFLVITAFACVACTGSGLNKQTGYAELSWTQFSGLDKGFSLKLGPKALSLIHYVMKLDNGQDPELAFLQHIQGVQVKNYKVANNQALANKRVAAAYEKLIEQNWQIAVSAKEADGERVHILIKHTDQTNTTLAGLCILALDNQEVVFVNVVGDFDEMALAQVMALSNKG